MVSDANSGLTDLYVTCQLWTDGKANSLPFRTTWKDFARSYRCVAFSSGAKLIILAGIRVLFSLSHTRACNPHHNSPSRSGMYKVLGRRSPWAAQL